VTDADLDELEERGKEFSNCADPSHMAGVDHGFAITKRPGVPEVLALIAEVRRLRGANEDLRGEIRDVLAGRCDIGGEHDCQVVKRWNRVAAAERLAEAVDAWDRDLDAGGTLSPFAEHIQESLGAWRQAR
jgi:hypothetical protein